MLREVAASTATSGGVSTEDPATPLRSAQDDGVGVISQDDGVGVIAQDDGVGVIAQDDGA